ncbi:nucleoporin complex subunit 54-domain-containing protein [Vararia minispora EC-137]|uniref:Nucleoporin complex subunit 54-domain-containing protein n=1 Tax=Vararia minispora EC-137 TaxID=1314806 RepID=A0ACB8Q6H5_9AGAM|nr:nucleoporin complex subunit 54-domain-containing protein [Vararia minispora EC-137]
MSLFGSTNNINQPSGSLFNPNISALNQPATNGLFGSANTSTNQPPSTGLFGSTNTTINQPAAGGLFGTSGTSSPQGATSGLFGSTSTPTNQPATGGGLFGSANTAALQPATGGLFGPTNNTSSQPATGGLFGSTTSTAQPAAGGGLFGPANTTQSGPFSVSANRTTSGGLFGSNAATAPAGGASLFGGAGASTSGGGLFGSANTVTAPAGTPSLFITLRTLLTMLAAAPSMFGSSKPTAGGGLLAPKSSVIPMQQQADAQAQFVQLSGRIERIVAAWNPDSPQNRFQHYFYNLVGPSQVPMYGRPANAHDEALWQRALMENPDPSCLVPVLATSFDDLQKRVEAQAQQATLQQERTAETRKRIAALSDAHALKNAPRLAQAVATQARLAARLRAVAQHLHLLIPTLRSTPLSQEEEELRIRLQEIESVLRSGTLVGKMNELWARANALRSAGVGSADRERMRWTVVDEEGLKQLVQILKDQHAGLEHVTKILRKGQKDLNRVIYGEEEAPTEKKPGAELLESVSQSLKGSTIR